MFRGGHQGGQFKASKGKVGVFRDEAGGRRIIPTFWGWLLCGKRGGGGCNSVEKISWPQGG